VAPERPTPASGVVSQRVFPSLSFTEPLAMAQRPNDPSRWFIAEKTGRLMSFQNTPGVSSAEIALDLSNIVDTEVEGGLLGFAFAPDFSTSGDVYIYYTAPTPTPRFHYRGIISRFNSDNGGLSFDPATEQVIMTIEQPWPIHNGGRMKFGPDGYLYIGLGDGGPDENAQDNTNVLGTFVRIHVRANQPGYSIPPDNPFAGNPQCSEGGRGTQPCPEIFAWGFRNPWGWNFDRQSGQLWAGDVGQWTREEVNIVQSGGNYGWPIREGFTCYQPAVGCPSAGLIDPILDYPNPEDGNSVTGGYVYRGTLLDGFQGRYIFGDFANGRLWVADPDASGDYVKTKLLSTGLNISSFAESTTGELFITHFGGGLYQLQPAGQAGNDTIPTLLSETGCVDPADPTQPATGLIPYRPGAPFWSDGADKERWLAVPDGARIGRDADGDFQFPPGSVLVKSFRRQDRLIETRLFMHHPDGTWAGYTYRWNEAQTDAERLVGGATLPAGGSDWVYPSEAQCMQCHSEAAGRSLGLEIAQQNNALTYPQTGRTANQLATLEAIDMFSSPLSGEPSSLPALPNPFGDAPLNDRARAYLHTNCASCHRPGGPTPSGMDLRYSTPLADTATCDVPASSGSDLGIADARLIEPGDPQRSLVWQRMGRRDVHAMPPVGSLEIDTAGLSLLQDWITSLGGCN
jgi:uncharacterized repeat protein (TIGR03806 family)